MRIKFSSVHLKEFVTINQSLIIGTHREAAGVLNFLASSLALSSLYLFISFFREWPIRKPFLCARESHELPSPSFLESFHFFLASGSVCWAQVAEFSKPKS